MSNPTLADAIAIGASLGVGAKDFEHEQEYTRGAVEVLAKLFLPLTPLSEAKNILTTVFEAIYEAAE